MSADCIQVYYFEGDEDEVVAVFRLWNKYFKNRSHAPGFCCSTNKNAFLRLSRDCSTFTAVSVLLCWRYLALKLVKIGVRTLLYDEELEIGFDDEDDDATGAVVDDDNVEPVPLGIRLYLDGEFELICWLGGELLDNMFRLIGGGLTELRSIDGLNSFLK